jgi:hypothetical protein
MDIRRLSQPSARDLIGDVADDVPVDPMRVVPGSSAADCRANAVLLAYALLLQDRGRSCLCGCGRIGRTCPRQASNSCLLLQTACEF